MTTTESRYRFQIWWDHLSSKRALHLAVVLPSENYFLFRQPVPPRQWLCLTDEVPHPSEESFLQLFIILFNLRASFAFANKDVPFATVILIVTYCIVLVKYVLVVPNRFRTEKCLNIFRSETACLFSTRNHKEVNNLKRLKLKLHEVTLHWK